MGVVNITRSRQSQVPDSSRASSSLLSPSCTVTRHQRTLRRPHVMYGSTVFTQRRPTVAVQCRGYVHQTRSHSNTDINGRSLSPDSPCYIRRIASVRISHHPTCHGSAGSHPKLHRRECPRARDRHPVTDTCFLLQKGSDLLFLADRPLPKAPDGHYDDQALAAGEANGKNEEQSRLHTVVGGIQSAVKRGLPISDPSVIVCARLPRFLHFVLAKSFAPARLPAETSSYTRMPSMTGRTS